MPRRPGLDRHALIGEAAALADERGLESVTLANLAERLNIRPPSLYNHIESATALARGLALFALRMLRDDIARAAIGKNGRAGLLAIADAYRAFGRRHPGLYAATQAVRQDDDDLQAIALESLDVIRAIMAPFELDPDTEIHAIRGFRSIVHGFVSLEALRGFGMPQSVDESFAFVLTSFVAGLEKRG